MNRQRHHREIALVDRLEPLMHQTPQNYKGGSGSYLLEGAKRIRLSTHAHQKLTTAGEVYWKQLKGEEPPKRYDYNQPLLLDKFIVARDGTKVQVRKRKADLSYEVYRRASHFAHHKILWVPLVPRLVVLYKGGKVNTTAKTGEAYVQQEQVRRLRSGCFDATPHHRDDAREDGDHRGRATDRSDCAGPRTYQDTATDGGRREDLLHPTP